jgi:GAF domain-containing protein
VVDHDALLGACTDYARTILGRYDVAHVLDRLSEQVTEVLAVPGVGISVGGDNGELRFATASRESVMRVEESQLEVAEGPCHDAWRNGEVVVVNDLSRTSRWPIYTPVALAAGWKAVAGVPMIVEDQHVGALNRYQDEPHDWTTEELRAAQLLADMATGYIVNARTLTESVELAQQLQHALDSRVVIEQAKGVLAGQHGLDTELAFELLRRHARNRGRKLHDVAREVVEGTLEL